MSCIYSTLHYVCDQAKQQNTKPVLTFDQPLFWKALTIITNESQNSDLKLIVLRLGGFSGLNEVLEVVYASNTVCHMLTGKAVSRSLRSHFLVDDSLNAMLLARLFDIQLPSLLQETELGSTDNKSDLSPEELPEVPHLDESTSVQVEDSTEGVTDKPNTVNEKLMLDDTLKEAGDLYEKLMSGEIDVETVCEHPVFEILDKSLLNEKRALLKYRTAKLWLQYMTMIDLLRKFLKAERTGNWQLHLQSVKEMLPYFAAAGHNLYVRSAYMYLQMMGKLEHEHPDIYQLFNDGYHVIRRSDRYWAGLSSDLIIEQVLMKSIKSTGGLTRGHGMSESQRTQWLLSMPACTDINNSMQKFTTVDYHTSDQHVESGLSRKERDQKDRLKFLSFLQERSPFVEEVSLRNIETGVEGDPSVNVDTAKEVGDQVIASMVGKSVLEYSFKKSEQAVTLNAKNTFKIGGEAIHVDPQLLFQRLVAPPDRLVENQAEIFSYELCSYPASLFEASGLLRQADKPSLASAIWCLGECGVQETLTEPLHYVLDGGSLIQRLPWTRGATFLSICNMYVDYVSRRYQNAIVVFNGYSAGPSTKGCTHLRRTHGLSSAKVIFTGNTPCKSKKEQFLANVENKQSFIYMLSQHLEEKGVQALHAVSDADIKIVKTAVECANVYNTIVIGEDTDLLILLLYHADVNSKRICFMSGANKSNVKLVKKWDILQTKRLLDQNVCSMLPFIHAITGCDTTSHVFGIGKGMALKKMISDNYLKEQAVKFTGVTSKAEIIQAGEEYLLCLYNGAPYEGLDYLRFRKFATKVMTNTSSVQVHALQPTSAAASYHSMRAYLQVLEWTENVSNLNPLEWGWKQAENLLLPIQTHLQPAPEDLLKIIRCSCKSNCDSKRCTCRKHGLECSPGCGECQGKSCLNAQTIAEMDLIDDI